MFVRQQVFVDAPQLKGVYFADRHEDYEPYRVKFDGKLNGMEGMYSVQEIRNLANNLNELANMMEAMEMAENLNREENNDDD